MINYIKGDATNPQAHGPKIIMHICNDRGGWGKGFVLAISKRWDAPEDAYRQWYNKRRDNDFHLGAVQFVSVRNDITVANMIAQEGFAGKSNPVPVKYDALKECLEKVVDFVQKKKASVHCPRIGCGLGGASWQRVELILNDVFGKKKIDITVYDL